MAPATVNAMARNPQMLQTIEPPRAKAPLQIEAPNGFDLREFVSDEDAKNFNSALWDSIDQTAFVLAQRNALEEFNVAKALRLSEETAAVESKRRSASAGSGSGAPDQTETRTSSSSSSSSSASSSSSVGSSSATQSQPIAIRKSQRSTSSAPAPSSDEAAAISLARSWRVDSLQPALLENNSPVSSSLKTHQKSSSVSTSSSSHQQQLPLSHHQHHHHHHERKPSSSIVKQPSKNLSLSTSSSSVDTRIASASDFLPLQVVHSRATPSNAIPSSSSTQSHRSEQRTLSKREPERSVSMSPPSSSSSSSSHVQTSDVTNAKRRRTEHPTTSTSTSSSHNMLVAPSISHSKKSTASARDVRLGQMINSISEIAASQQVQAAPSMEQRSKSRHASAHKSSDTDLFTAPRRCAKANCVGRLISPRTDPSFTPDPFAFPFSGLLHIACSEPACRTVHCRGCSSIVRCPPDCSGNATCTVRNCCPDVRAIAIFEALSSFDHMYIDAVEAGFAGKTASGKLNHNHQLRQAYIKYIISKADQNSRFENAFVHTLRILCSWLQREKEDSDEGETKSFLHPSVPKLLASSLLLEVIHAFLSNTNVRDWISHNVTYSAILDILRHMFDCGLKELMTRPLTHIQHTLGLQSLMWDLVTISWEVDQGTGRPVESASLCDLVKQLEEYRVPLMQFGDKIQFKLTVEKVNNLCDGISYLLLQQVVGGL